MLLVIEYQVVALKLTALVPVQINDLLIRCYIIILAFSFRGSIVFL